MWATGAPVYGIILSGLGRVNSNTPLIYIPKSYLDRSILTTWTLVFSPRKKPGCGQHFEFFRGVFLKIMIQGMGYVSRL